MNYKIISFNPATGSAQVRFTTEDWTAGLVYSVDIPVENGAYISGQALAEHILAFAPHGQIARLVALRDTPPSTAGIVVEPDPVPEVPAPTTLEELTKVYTDAVQNHLDVGARARGYDNIVSACSYAGYTNAFEAEGISFGQWRAACWVYCYAELAKVEVGTRPLPTIPEILAELPARVLPE